MANKALSKILDARDARQRSAIQANLMRSMGVAWPSMNTGISTPYAAWTSGDPTGLARPANQFTQGGFAPVTPIQPFNIDMPRDGSPRPQPRRWEYPVAWNMPTPPGTEGMRLTSFSMMRTYADVSTIVRACINKRIEEICGLEWDIVPTADKQKELENKATRKDFDARRQQAMAFFNKPDPDYNTFHSWLKAVLEDIFVIDALSIYLAPRLDGDATGGLFGSPLAGLMLIDGSTIRPMVALDGGRPQPPAVAYQQFIWGIPRVDLLDALTQEEQEEAFDPAAKVADLMGDQLLYLPYNKRTKSPYGYSHVEQCLIPTGIELNKQQYVLGYYKEGNTPSSWVTIGNVDTPQQVRQWQDTLDAMIGDVGARHQVFVLPHGSSAVETKPNILRDEYDATNRETIFAIFGLTAMEMGFLPGGKSGGLTGGSGMAANAATEKIRTASIPLCMFLKRNIFDLVLQGICGQDDMQFQWPDLLAVDDAMQQMQEDIAFTTNGIRTRDEIRRERGWLPFDLPLTNEPTVTTPTTGVTSLVGNPSGSASADTSPLAQQQQQQQLALAAASRPAVAPVAGGAGKPVTPTTSKPGVAANTQNAPKPATSNANAQKMQDELRQLQNFVRHGRSIEKFEVSSLPPAIVKFVSDNLNRGAGIAFEEARYEIERSTDPLYTGTAMAVARTIRQKRSGALAADAARAQLVDTLRHAVDVSKRDIPIHMTNDIANEIAEAEDTFGVLQSLKRFHALVTKQVAT